MAVSNDQNRADDLERSVTILGSTGSIGRNTLDLIKHARNDFALIALTGNQNVKLLIKQARLFKPKFAVIGNEELYDELKAGLNGTNVQVAAGKTALKDAAQMNSDVVVAGIVGIAGLVPTITAVKRGAIIALANKECLVCSGTLFLDEIERNGATLIPIDSEHNAIFQVFNFNQIESVDRLILTASGGPFISTPLEDLKKVTPSEATKHPNWNMGSKISVDSATMMNKGLELIEAFYLFPVEEHQIEILVHPQSVIHSMVSYNDGSVLAQMGAPDMRTPISYALAWPNRMDTNAQKLNLMEIGKLTFEKPDLKRFPALNQARDALISGKAMPTILNAANEVAVEYFLEGKIGFLDITRVTGEVLNRSPNNPLKEINDIPLCDKDAREIAKEVLKSIVK